MKNKRKIKINDKVLVISGDNKGSSSTVIGFFKKDRVVLKGINMRDVFVNKRIVEGDKVVWKKIKISKESGIHISNVAKIDEKNK